MALERSPQEWNTTPVKCHLLMTTSDMHALMLTKRDSFPNIYLTDHSAFLLHLEHDLEECASMDVLRRQWLSLELRLSSAFQLALWRKKRKRALRATHFYARPINRQTFTSQTHRSLYRKLGRVVDVNKTSVADSHFSVAEAA